MKRQSSTQFLIYAVWAFVALLLAFLLVRNAGYGWDSRCYRQFAVEYFTAGGNPYTRSGWPLSYPPLILYLFRPMTLLSANTFNMLWTILKLLGFCFIFRLWHRHFLPMSWKDYLQVMFIALAFNGALYYDLASGNLAGFQEIFLWIGFVALLQGRVWFYYAIIILMAFIKLDLIALLAIPLFVEDRPPWVPMILMFVLFVGMMSLNYWIFPALCHDYVKVFQTLGTRSMGTNNPTSLTFSLEFIHSLDGGNFPISLPAHSGEAMYILLVLGVIGVSLAAWRRMQKQGQREFRTWAMLFFIVVFGLINPRVPPYLYVLFLLPSLWILQKYRQQALIPLAGVFAMFPQGTSSFPRPVNQFFLLFNTYLPLMALYAVWVLYLKDSYSPASSSAE